MRPQLVLFDPVTDFDSLDDGSAEARAIQSKTAELFVQFWLVANGLKSVVRGAEGESYDLIVPTGANHCLVQVKSSSRRHGDKTRFRILQNRAMPGYGKEDFDILALVSFVGGDGFPTGMGFIPFSGLSHYTCFDLSLNVLTLDRGKLQRQWHSAGGTDLTHGHASRSPRGDLA
jgi:hypothetical protein